jgi:hypothetical protein
MLGFAARTEFQLQSAANEWEKLNLYDIFTSIHLRRDAKLKFGARA